MRAIVKSDFRVTREEMPRDEAIDALRRDGRALQGRDHRGHSRAGRVAVPAGRVRRPLPRPARAVDRHASRREAHRRRRRLLARRRAQRDAAAHLRHGVRQPRSCCEEHLARIEEAKKRDHRRLGKELDLFTFDVVAPGSPFFHPKGAIVYNELVDYVRGLYRRYGYDEVITPQMMDVELWKRSGHYDNYRENMFFSQLEEREFAVKPMNCPSHCLIYASRKRSYRELPIRYADFGRLHRAERSGTLHGLTRVRSFSQDDAHIFCMPEQIGGEISALLRMIDEVYRDFGFDERRVMLSTRPEKSIGSDEMWEQAEGALAEALRGAGIDYRDQRRRRRLLRTEDRLRRRRCAEAAVAARHRAARLRRAAGALRSQLRAAGRQRGAAGDDPPRHPRHDRALHGHPHRALRRRVPALAGAGAGARADADRAHAGLRPDGVRRAARGGLSRRARRPQRKARLQGARGAARQGSVHAGGRRQGSGGAHRGAAQPHAAAAAPPSASTRSSPRWRE